MANSISSQLGSRAKDMTGMKCGRLTVKCLHPERKNGRICWECQCECGGIAIVTGKSLRNGVTQSCGCLHREKTTESNLIDLTGRRFGRLLVIERKPTNAKRGEPLWNCVCDCGKVKAFRGTKLRRGESKSCGCFQREELGNRRRKHGRSRTLEYGVWSGMKRRCYNSQDSAYEYYGGRGIQVCQEWIDSFDVFMEQMGERPSSSYSIERVNNDGNYCQDNCHWATQHEQRRNRRDNRVISFNGESMVLADWAERTGIRAGTIHARIKRGWSVEKALTTPVGTVSRHTSPPSP